MNSDLSASVLKDIVSSLIRNSLQIKKKQEADKEEPKIPELQSQTIKMNSVENLMKSQEVESIECLGPKKKILLRKSGKTYFSDLSLSEEEIINLIEGFARFTGTSSNNGILRTTYNDWIITAVTSKFSGSRFVLQRTN